MSFDTDKELEKLREQTKVIRKTKHYKSRIDRHKGEVIRLHKAGATVAEVQRFLRSKRIKLAYSTVHRWLSKHG
jgi:hypothetical protein